MGRKELVDTAADIELMNWLARVQPILEVSDLISKVSDAQLRTSLEEKISRWASIESIMTLSLEDEIPKLQGHKDSVLYLREAGKKIRELAVRKGL